MAIVFRIFEHQLTGLRVKRVHPQVKNTPEKEMEICFRFAQNENPTSNHMCTPFSWEACARPLWRCASCSQLWERSVGFAKSCKFCCDSADRHLDWCWQIWSWDAKAEHCSLSKARWDCRPSGYAWTWVWGRTRSSPCPELSSAFVASRSPVVEFKAEDLGHLGHL